MRGRFPWSWSTRVGSVGHFFKFEGSVTPRWPERERVQESRGISQRGPMSLRFFSLFSAIRSKYHVECRWLLTRCRNGIWNRHRPVRINDSGGDDARTHRAALLWASLL
mmetsp:Transcript_6609/g.13376  ORF Transcript_6609/g.13376 Transcript_6609/m.13376 type:complete len:109 (-) Transcript_6609:1873-2199(-)